MKLTVVNLCKKIKDRVILDNINLNLEVVMYMVL